MLSLSLPHPWTVTAFNSSNYTCTTDRVSQALLTISRFAAGALFPSIGFCMVSKCYATRFFLNRSWIAFIVDFEPTHTLHTCELVLFRGAKKSFQKNPSALHLDQCSFQFARSARS